MITHQKTMTPVIVVLFCLVARSLQCSCPQRFTQSRVCNSMHVLNVTIGKFERNEHETVYQVTVNKVFHGNAAVGDKLAVTTPEGTSMCGPIRLEEGETYILAANKYTDSINLNLCNFFTKAKAISLTELNGISGAYRQSCNCKQPYEFELGLPGGARTPDQCGSPPDSCRGWDSICATDAIGQCNWTC